VTAKRIDLSRGRDAFTGIVAGEMLLLSGPMIAARDAAQERIARTRSGGGDVPFDLAGTTLYYMSPAPGRGGMAAGSAGPTTSSRMDRYLEMLISMGVAATVGKGPRSAPAAGLCARYGVPYLAAVGGAGAFYAGRIIRSEVLCWPDLGPEAVYRLEVADFPVFTGIDANGASMFPWAGGPVGLG
jgi:fumarate hydratase subunit beta